MSKLVIDPDKSMYKPIEVVVGKKVFKVKRINRPIYRRLEELEAEIKKGNIDALYRQLELFVGKSKYIDNLDVREIAQINEFIVKKLFAPEKKGVDEEKNVTKLGDNK